MMRARDRCQPLSFLCLAAVIAGSLQLAAAAEREEPRIEVAEGFSVERIYLAPREEQGSWVALTVDPQGRLIAGDQKGQLYRVTLESGQVESVEALDVDVGFAHGLCHAFGSLYAVVAEDEYKGSGLYRISDTDGDDAYDEVVKLRDLHGSGEHGPHSVVAGPEGKWLYVVAGNKTAPLEGADVFSWVPRHWGEDDLLPRIWGPIGSEKGTEAPGGWIARTDPDGAAWELVAIGLRNAFDLAFNADGELFATDADAEFDLGTPWYQPTRLLHVAKGADFGWRSGSGKWRSYFEDTLPPVHEYGPGSPTGVAFGYGTNFPADYQRALFACDWSWGRIFVTRLDPAGASYVGETEVFLTGMPLPIADIVVNPVDKSMYFVLGGRGTSSSLHRISYLGAGETAEAPGDGDSDVADRSTQRELERKLSAPDEAKVRSAWPHLASSDQRIRHSARILLEHADAAHWQEKALLESHPFKRITALLALARSGKDSLLPRILGSLLELNWRGLTTEEQLMALRALEVAFIRMGEPGETAAVDAPAGDVGDLLEAFFPAKDARLNEELAKLLVYLESDEATAKAVQLMEEAVTQEEALSYLLILRMQTAGWSPELRERYFAVLGEAQGWTGGLSLSKYIYTIAQDSLAHLPEKQRTRYQAVLDDAQPKPDDATDLGDAQVVRQWSLEDLLPLSIEDLQGRDVQKGHLAFKKASCFACHRVAGEGGGIGPDLTAAARRFGTRDLLEAIINPSAAISDQYGLTIVEKTDGTALLGRIVNYFGDSIGLQTNPLHAANLSRIPRKDIASMRPAPVSSMPAGLLDTLTKVDILDLLAFLHEKSAAAGHDEKPGP